MDKYKNFALGMLVLPVALLGVAVAFASTVAIPNTFTAGTTAVAAEVNANFAAVKTAVDDNFSLINTNVAKITANDARLTVLETDRVLASGEDLRVVQGLVVSDGTIFDGVGFTIAHTAATGSYTITYDTPFSGNASIAVQVYGSPGDTADGEVASATDHEIVIYDSALAVTDEEFTFISVGAN